MLAAARRLPCGAAARWDGGGTAAVAAAVERNASKQDLGKESLLRRLPAEQWADATPLPPPRCLAALAAAHIFVSVCDVFCSS